VGSLVAIFPAAENVEKSGARDPAGWSGVIVMCAAQELSSLLDQKRAYYIYFDLSEFIYAANALLFH